MRWWHADDADLYDVRWFPVSSAYQYLHTERAAAAAGFGGVGIVECKAASHESVGIVEGNAHQVEDAFAVDEDFHVVGFENAVIFAGGGVVAEGVGHSGASAAFDTDAEAVFFWDVVLRFDFSYFADCFEGYIDVVIGVGTDDSGWDTDVIGHVHDKRFHDIFLEWMRGNNESRRWRTTGFSIGIKGKFTLNLSSRVLIISKVRRLFGIELANCYSNPVIICIILRF